MTSMPTRAAITPVAAILLVAAVVAVVRLLPHDDSYSAELRHAAGISEGDPVRVAGLEVGEVSSVRAERDTVHVEFTTGDDVELTEDTATQVKLASLLGQRYLNLAPGDGEPLDEGGTITRAHAVDTYTMERFWLEGPDQVGKLDPEVIDDAIGVLSTDLAGSSGDVRAALDGMASVAGIVNRRDAQIGELLESTGRVTDLVLAQQDELDALMGDAELVMQMVVERREAIGRLLRDTRSLVTDVAALTQRNQEPVTRALRDVRRLLGTLTEHKSALDRTLELLGPTMRHFTSSSGDGPWQGVNSPFAILPDDLICVVVPTRECR